MTDSSSGDDPLVPGQPNKSADVTRAPEPPGATTPEPPLIEGVDYEMENGLFVLKRDYLLRRGHCCQSGCRHCPYGFHK